MFPTPTQKQESDKKENQEKLRDGLLKNQRSSEKISAAPKELREIQTTYDGIETIYQGSKSALIRLASKLQKTATGIKKAGKSITILNPAKPLFENALKTVREIRILRADAFRLKVALEKIEASRIEPAIITFFGEKITKHLDNISGLAKKIASIPNEIQKAINDSLQLETQPGLTSSSSSSESIEVEYYSNIFDTVNTTLQGKKAKTENKHKTEETLQIQTMSPLNTERNGFQSIVSRSLTSSLEGAAESTSFSSSSSSPVQTLNNSEITVAEITEGEEQVVQDGQEGERNSAEKLPLTAEPKEKTDNEDPSETTNGYSSNEEERTTVTETHQEGEGSSASHSFAPPSEANFSRATGESYSGEEEEPFLTSIEGVRGPTPSLPPPSYSQLNTSELFHTDEGNSSEEDEEEGRKKGFDNIPDEMDLLNSKHKKISKMFLEAQSYFNGMKKYAAGQVSRLAELPHEEKELKEKVEQSKISEISTSLLELKFKIECVFFGINLLITEANRYKLKAEKEMEKLVLPKEADEQRRTLEVEVFNSIKSLGEKLGEILKLMRRTVKMMMKVGALIQEKTAVLLLGTVKAPKENWSKRFSDVQEVLLAFQHENLDTILPPAILPSFSYSSSSQAVSLSHSSMPTPGGNEEQEEGVVVQSTVEPTQKPAPLSYKPTR